MTKGTAEAQIAKLKLENKRLRDEVKKLRSQLSACVKKYSEAVIEGVKLREELRKHD